MTRVVTTLGLDGIRGSRVAAECAIMGGLPAFDIVGLPDASVREARERVRAAVKACGMKFPVSHITVNLAPADTRKEGTIYDLPILLGILSASEAIKPLPADSAFIGELSLTGELRAIKGALPMAAAAAREGIKRVYLPAANAAEAAFAGGVEAIPVKDVGQLLACLAGDIEIEPAAAPDYRSSADSLPDFADVKGHAVIKRALEVAAAGSHNVLMMGPPGSGKSMLAARLPSILPEMSREEALEVTEIHSVAGITSEREPIITARPFRAPHHTISTAGLTGGGTNPRPGEISLAHGGVLFLDEFPEFPRTAVEALRQPVESGVVTISRASGSFTFPSRFMLVAAMNPCRCGWYGTDNDTCHCSPADVRRYRSRVSGPLLDRIDVFLWVEALRYEDLSKYGEGEPSAVIRARVNAARDIQRRRFEGSGIRSNSEMDQAALREFCALDDAGSELMRRAYSALDMSARAYDRTLRLARTIADLAGSERIAVGHLAEAMSYRNQKKGLEG